MRLEPAGIIGDGAPGAESARTPRVRASADYILAILSSEYFTLSNSWVDLIRLNEYISA